jgi:signal transduction histidine kinase
MPSVGVPHRSDSHPLSMPGMRLGSLVLAAIFLLATGVTGFVTVDRMQSSRDLVLHTYQVRGLLKDLRSDIGSVHANFELYQLTGNVNDVAHLDEQLQRELATVAALQKLTTDNALQQVRLDAFQESLQQDIDQLTSCVRQQNCLGSSSPSRNEFLATIAGRRRTMSDMLGNMESMEDTLLQTRLKTWHRLFIRLVIILATCFTLALLLLAYNFGLLFREIERSKQQAQIEKNNTESYKMLSARILELQDVERRRIARELHDSVGQFLAGLKINLGRLQRREAEATAQSYPLLLEALDLTDRAIGEVRTISHLLHPPLLDELGFHSAARWYAEGFAKRSGIQVNLHLAEVTERLPKQIELALFRVLQESLTNVHRHAKASTVDIEVRCTDDLVILAVSDDGRGLHPDVLERFRGGHAGGIGLAGMRERLAELGGRLEVDSGPTGTRIRAILSTHECDPADAAPENISISPG